MKGLLIFFGVFSTSTTPISFASNFVEANNNILNINNNVLDLNNKINLNNIKTNDVKMDVGSLKGSSEEKIKSAVLLEIVKQNDGNEIINDVVMGAIYQPELWDISGIRFVVPEANKSDKYSAKITAKTYNPIYENTLFVNIELTNRKIEDISYNINTFSETWGVGKAWGTGNANKHTVDISKEVDLGVFGGINLLRENYYSIDVTFSGNYFFQKGKKFNWDNYHREKTYFNSTETFVISKNDNFGKWKEVKFVESEKGGYKWGNYYKAFIKLDFINDKLVITSKYEIAAYGVGSNWYWTAGDITLNKVLFKAKTTYLII
ncbi:hypothetical protein [Spiroplasma sp. BIUS-1]|uniref:hypothetical protein n=1 Tax=Spiroplasma sp. BIUS-1 TaxID=216964 RepID=UPI001396D49C|nr:hypothetical protein [Spiroplasma sp. BIUS-1]QHX37034.1 hypothetical protein SBIUS_v1c07810 [Spiroplasma sp. BIUS-1]